MSNFSKRMLAVGSTSALVAAGLTAGIAPAYAAGEVTLAPSTGTNYSVFNTDEFVLKTSTITAAVSAANLTYRITDADSGKWYVRVGDLAAGNQADATVTLSFKDVFGNAVDADETDDGTQTSVNLTVFSDGTTDGMGTAGDANEAYGEFLVDLGDLGATEMTISAIGIAPDGTDLLTISPYEGAVNAKGHEAINPAAGNTGADGNADEYDHGDGAASATVQAWIEITGNATTLDTAYASSAQTVTWVDPKGVAAIPRVERYVDSGASFYLNDDTAGGNTNLGATLKFARSGLNLDQVDITKWNYNLTQSDGTAIKATANLTTGMQKTKSGDLRKDSSDKLYLLLPVGEAITIDKTYKVVVDHDGATAVDFGSVAFSLPTSSEQYHIEATIGGGTDKIQTSHQDTAVEVRPGVKSFTWTAQIKTDDDTVAETASVPVMALIKSTTYIDGSWTVSGSNESIAGTSGYAVVNGFTDSDGQWEVTVTSSSATAGEVYVASFYVVDSGGADDQAEFVVTDDAADGTNAVHTVTYTAPAAGTLTATNGVLSGESITAEFTATDQYAAATAVNGTKALSVELKSSDGTTYDEDVALAADGTATFTFDNYLGAGESDVLTATLYTGTSSAPTTITSAVVTLYNAASVAAIQVPASLTTNITYDDFIVGKTSAAAPAPNDGAVTLTGTVVDANGAGVPGASVTISAPGMQLVKNGGTVFAKDSITFAASAAGVFQVDIYAHETKATGHTVTVTAGGKTATTLLKTYLPATGVDGNNLVFTLDMPANVVKNTTYAVVASLKDKWGNPIKTADRAGVSALSIQGVGSVQINSVDAATTKNFGADGTVTVFLRSIKDIAGPGSVTANLQVANYSAGSGAAATALTITEIALDVATTAHDETSFSNSIDETVEVLGTAPAATPSADQKVNAGSFKGYVALYAKGYAGKRMSAKVGKDWVVVPVLASNFERVVEYTGAGYTVAVRIYIDRVLIDTITVTTK